MSALNADGRAGDKAMITKAEKRKKAKGYVAGLFNMDERLSKLTRMGEMMRDQIGSDIRAESQEEMLKRYAANL